MVRIEAHFRVVTPLFLAGFDQSAAELRVPSIKGVLRFWWRAMAYSQLKKDSPHQILSRLRGKEAAIFGSTSQQSSIHLKIANQELKCETQKKGEWPLVVVNDEQGREDSHSSRAIPYVSYGIVESTKGNARRYIAPDSTFTLALTLKNPDNIRGVISALLAFGFLGGLGSRSRRGWGSVAIEKIDMPSEFDQEVLVALNDFLELFTSEASTSETYPEFSSFSPSAKIEPSSQLFERWEEALNYAAAIYRYVARDTWPKSYKEGLGLPRKSVGANSGKRRASPVIIHIHKLEGKHCVLATFLPAQFLEGKDKPDGNYSPARVFLTKLAEGLL